MDELVEEGITIIMGGEQPVADAALPLPADGLGDAAVEALGHAVGLRPVRPGQPMLDAGLGADPVEGVPAGGLAFGFAFHVHGEPVGEFRTVVGEDSMNGCREVIAEAFEECGGGLGVAARVDLQIDIAGCPVDGDEGIAFAALQRRQVFQIDPRLREDKRE